MSGSDIIILGVAADDLSQVLTCAGKKLRKASLDKKLDALFAGNYEGDGDGELWYQHAHYLEQNPLGEDPRITYFKDECAFGAALGQALGYIIFSGNLNSMPKRLSDAVWSRVPELKDKFSAQIKQAGLFAPMAAIGVYAINVVDT